MAYATETGVRSIFRALDANLADEDKIEEISEQHVDWRIDAALGTTFPTPPQAIVSIASMMVAAILLCDVHYQTKKKPEAGTALKKEAKELLDMIAAGEMTIEGVAASGLVLSELNPDRPKDEVFVGEAEDWRPRVETRES